MMEEGKEPSGRAYRGWLLQRVTGVGLIVLLGFHFAVEHFIVGGAEVNFSNTVERMTQGVISGQFGTVEISALLYQTIAILLLGFSIYHGFNGVYTIATEQGWSRKAEKTVRAVLVVGGIALFIQGILIFRAFTATAM